MSKFKLLATALALVAFGSVAPAGESLGDALAAKAPAIHQKLKKKGFENVGVLKFLCKKGDEAPRDDMGELNTTLAIRTQVALILANKDEAFGILENPGKHAVAQKLREANHRTEAGRKAFFEIEYPASWGKGTAAPSGFITGTATLDKDLRSASIQLHLFDKTGAMENLLDEWAVDLDSDVLGEAAQNFALLPIQRKALVSGGTVTKKEVQDNAVETMKVALGAEAKKKPNPALEICPVKWEIHYDKKKQSVSGDTVPEPNTGEDVRFVLTNPNADETFAVVLLVNGENTLYQEREAPKLCRKWILEPRTETVIDGFQTEKMKASKFVVVAPEDPLADGVRYSENFGLFRMVVYAGRVTDKAPMPAKFEAEDRLVLANTRLDDRPRGLTAQTLSGLQASLTQRTKDARNSRGAVVKGKNSDDSKTEEVHFAPVNGPPIADITLRYLPAKK